MLPSNWPSEEMSDMSLLTAQHLHHMEVSLFHLSTSAESL